MKNIGLFYFSGTGTTKLVCNIFKENFEGLNEKVTVYCIDEIVKANEKVSLEQFDLVGIGTPILGFGIPRLVLDFLKKLDQCNELKTFVFFTCAGIGAENSYAPLQIKKVLSKKGFDIVYERFFPVASNWMVKFKDEAVKKLHKVTYKKVSRTIDEIFEGKERYIHTGFVQRIIFPIVTHFSSNFFRIVAKDLYANETCIKCGLCIKKCPTNNIHIKKDKIQFHSRCLSCMRCIYICPRKALNYHIFKFFPLKDGFDIVKTINKNDEEVSSLDGIIPTYLDAFIADIDK